MQGTWQSAGSSTAAYTYTTTSAASPNPAQTALAHPSPYGAGRSSMLQPSMSYMTARSSQQQPLGAPAEALPAPAPAAPPQPPPFQHHPDVQAVPSYQNTLSSTGPSPHHHHPSSAPPPQLQNPTSTLSSQSAVTQAPTPASSTSAGGAGDFRPPPTPGAYSTYPTSSTPSQPSFPSYAPQPSPTHPHHHPSPTTSGGLSRGLSSISAGPSLSGMAAPQMGYGGPPPVPRPGYPYHHQLPGVAAPVMSNIGNPGGQMALVSGVSGMSLPPGFGPHSHHPMMFGHSQQPSQERPFKCDTCPQSFNRNHDLKRHKRIHLAVKPFPCTFCEKSFSRKDALKVSFFFLGVAADKREKGGGGGGSGSGSHDLFRLG